MATSLVILLTVEQVAEALLAYIISKQGIGAIFLILRYKQQRLFTGTVA
jgi:hypothetical protein